MIKKENFNSSERFIAGLFFAGCFIFFFFFYKYHLYFEEQLQVFLLTGGYAFEYLHKPAFLSSKNGDFLTQFWYLTGGGPLVIVLTLIVLWILIRKLISRFSIPGSDNKSVDSRLLAMIPVIFGWIALTDVEYPLAGIISLIISVSFTLIYISVKRQVIRIIAGSIMLPLLYIMAGSSFYLLVAIAVFSELFRVKDQRRPLTPLILIAVTLVVPVLLKGAYHITLLQSYSWLSVSRMNPAWYDFIPLISLILTVILAPAFSFRRSESFMNPFLKVILQSVLLIIFLGSGIYLKADFSLEKILGLDYEASHNRWKKVYDFSVKYKLRNNVATCYTNMAMSKLSILPEKLLEFYQPAATGLFIPVNANENYLTITFSNEIYWQLGDVNASQHSALLGMIFSPRSRNVRLLKRLAEINIVNGQYQVAEKYLNILDKTLYYRKWAEARRKFLNNEDECSKSQWIMSKREIIPRKDLLKKANSYKETLEMLIEANPANKMAVDYLLCYDLLDKNLPSFIDNFKKYYSSGTKTLIPKAYQEAVLIGIASGKYTPGDFENYIFTPEYVRKMADYTRRYNEAKGNGSALMKDYGKTYWFYYHFAAINKN